MTNDNKPPEAQALVTSMEKCLARSKAIDQSCCEEAMEHIVDIGNMPAGTKPDSTALTAHLLESIQAVKDSLELLLQRDGAFARKKGMDKGPIGQLLDAERDLIAQGNSLEEFNAHRDHFDALFRTLGIEQSSWQEWRDHMISAEGTPPREKLVEVITGECSQSIMDSMEFALKSPGDQNPEALRAATAIAKKLQEAFPVPSPLSETAILWRENPGEHARKLLQDGNSQFEKPKRPPGNPIRQVLEEGGERLNNRGEMPEPANDKGEPPAR